MNRYEQLIIRILKEFNGCHQIHAVNSLFQNELIKQRVEGSLSTAFREAIESLEEKEILKSSENDLKLLKLE